MELRQLKTFQMVGKLLSFNRAADALNYAQSTVSVQIRGLEEEFGVPLFDRLGKQVVLTEAGQTLMRYAQKMLDMEEETHSELAGRTQSQGSLCVRIPQSLGTYFLPSILQRFHARYPNVGFDINKQYVVLPSIYFNGYEYVLLHDWCSVRISKEIVEFASGKEAEYQWDRATVSAALSAEQQAILEQRGVLSPAEIHRLANKVRGAVTPIDDKAECHSDYVDSAEAQRIQKSRLEIVELKTP